MARANGQTLRNLSTRLSRLNDDDGGADIYFMDMDEQEAPNKIPDWKQIRDHKVN